ncbi:hypothetical protein MUU47_04425 [Scandinavium sp. H11S7]|uniref:DUF7916 domain-containing protein n=1 Tax=Scandinavium hiltneri TaxID=2926519 RepID=A0ABT2DXN4_9ENTR|nr:hypothetical protein [Scandinavium hiltneri]MCS2160381.1 hypothetical protein [Scandinavium hiltneri]
MQRILNCRASDFQQSVTGPLLRDAIAACEGRVIMAEVAAEAPALFAEVSNAELLCAFGADLLLLKGLNCQQPVVTGGHSRFGENAITQMKKLTGRLVGVSLEVLDPSAPAGANVFSEANLAAVQHADFFCLTGYDKPGVTLDRMCDAIAAAGQQTDKMILVAKFCTAGLALPQEYAAFIAAGAHGVIFPAPAGCRGASEAKVAAIVDVIQQQQGLAITTLSSSQEGADCATVREIGLASKRCGSDMHNFGDAGVAGMASPEAVNALSMAIRGRRHTWVRMAASLSR